MNAIVHAGGRLSPVSTMHLHLDMLKKISRGCFGHVFLAKDTASNSVVAVKISGKEKRTTRLDRAIQEHSILKLLSGNRAVVKCHELLETPDDFYLVMEYVPGGDLQSLLQVVGSCDEQMTRVYAAELALALHSVHESGVLHLDLKPANILLDRRGHLLLTDFGLSEMVRRGEKHEKLVPAGSRGTPDYMSPEVVQGCSYGHEADWWSLGVVIFECLTGMPPFHASCPHEVFENIRSREISWPDCLNISAEAKDFVEKFFAVKPEDRLRDIRDVQRHPFLSGIDWEHLLTSDGPFTPQLESDVDTSYFRPSEAPGTICPADSAY